MHEQEIKVSGGTLAAYSAGSGPDVIFLHGGPGDTHHYMRRMAEPLFAQFRCVFFDQRGTGGSLAFDRTSENFRMENLFADLRAVKKAMQLREPALVGHSWGAMYALYACINDPKEWSRAALISMGPLDAKMREAVGQHLLSVLDDQEKSRWTSLRETRNQARERGDSAEVERCDRELMSLRVRAWVVNPELRAPFLEEYFSDPAPDRVVNHLIWPAAEKWFSWDRLSRIRVPLWLCSGEQDSVPADQAERVAFATPFSRTVIYEKCGHMPWLERRDQFYEELRTFLT